MTIIEAIHSAVKEGMTVFDYSPDGDEVSALFQKLVGKKGKVTSIRPTTKTISLDNITGDKHIDVLYMNVQGKTLPFLGGSEEVLKRDRPIVFIVVDKDIIQEHGYDTKDIRDFMISAGFMNMRLDKGQYAFTYEHHPSRVLL